MKKLFALMVALCLLCSAAMAEETEEETLVLSWEDVLSQDAEIESLGSYQFISLDGIGNFVYWIPRNLSAVDVSGIPEDQRPVAAFASDDQAYTVSVYLLSVSLDAYAEALAGQGADVENAHLLEVNGIQAVSVENEAEDIDMLIIPVADELTMVYALTPLNEDGWDETKSVIVASVQFGNE